MADSARPRQTPQPALRRQAATSASGEPTAIDWLPDHHLAVLGPLGRADTLIAEVGSLLHTFHAAGPLQFKTIHQSGRTSAVVDHVRPLPTALALLVADTVANLRSALEHTLFAEITHRLGSAPTGQTARAVEMPACTTYQSLQRWLADKRRTTLPLRPGSPLAVRITDLQPFQRNKHPERHPLAVLVAHSNASKHRAPLIAAVHLGTVIPDYPVPGLSLPEGAHGRPLTPGDVLAETPTGAPTALSIWPTVSIQRPTTGTWANVMHELRDLELWVRTIAVPHLITGQHAGLNPIPPGIDVNAGHENPRDSLLTARSDSAAIRADRAMQAVIVGEGLVDVLTMEPDPLTREVAKRWAAGLSDDDALLAQTNLAGPRGHRDVLNTEHGATDAAEMLAVINRFKSDARGRSEAPQDQ